eukprot:TRINITY_DN35722_c0_g1_i1.p1 TRINITY_DN35722_c0_g1~~TRINITY_DN35722_c0_g1_i1.p1  ORF type:complete len:209 (-),score=28.41 TRINITY_DN35722_c0_g1_i1:205-750(-)
MSAPPRTPSDPYSKVLRTDGGAELDHVQSIEQTELAKLTKHWRILAQSCCTTFTCRHETIPTIELLKAYLPTLDAALRMQASEALVTNLQDTSDADPTRLVVVRVLILAQLASPEIVTQNLLEELVGDIIAISTFNSSAHAMLHQIVNILKLLLPHNSILEHDGLACLKPRPKRKKKRSQN